MTSNCVVILTFMLDSDFTESSSHIKLEETITIEDAMMETTVRGKWWYMTIPTQW